MRIASTKNRHRVRAMPETPPQIGLPVAAAVAREGGDHNTVSTYIPSRILPKLLVPPRLGARLARGDTRSQSFRRGCHAKDLHAFGVPQAWHPACGLPWRGNPSP